MNDSSFPSRKTKSGTGGVKKGFGMYDWQRLLKASKDLAQRNGEPIREMTMEEISCHNKVYDGWIVLHDKVYNIAPYLAYHPGGSDIIKPWLGKDSTASFEKYHPWVNVEG